jgi:hypothetical protein
VTTESFLTNEAVALLANEQSTNQVAAEETEEDDGSKELQDVLVGAGVPLLLGYWANERRKSRQNADGIES